MSSGKGKGLQEAEVRNTCVYVNVGGQSEKGKMKTEKESLYRRHTFRKKT